MKYYIRTYGCQMNFNDSERIRAIFELFGLEETSYANDADYVVLNSCAVRKSAEQKLLGFGKQLNSYKNDRENGYPRVLMTGCIIKTGINNRVRSKPVQKVHSLWSNIDWIDEVAPTKYIFNKLINALNNDINIEVKLSVEEVQNYLDIAPKAYSSITGSVPISVGCNHHCTFCTVPFSRGKEEFRDFEKVKREFESYVNKGYKQITLLGQTVNKWLNPELEYPPSAYGWYKPMSDFPKALSNSHNSPQNFLDLLKYLDSIPGDYWLNFISCYPNYFNNDLIDYIVESIKSKEGHIIPQIHLAVQSGSNRLLESMARHHTVEDFKSIISRFRSKLPGISITTDIIVGFSGESEEDFLQTAKLVEESNFDMVYISEYSLRPDTPAEQVEDNVSKEEKKVRKQHLNTILEKTLANRNKQFEFTESTMLPVDRKHGNLIGKNQYGKDIELITSNIKEPNKLIGSFVRCKIISSNAWNLKAEIV